ncbi:hypothetical protein B0J14DRAFT_167659 [Halenospora varia]|nr:hypothetical protein B0J14DRAFT_167659 [Halenospora varia]
MIHWHGKQWFQESQMEPGAMVFVHLPYPSVLILRPSNPRSGRSSMNFAGLWSDFASTSIHLTRIRQSRHYGRTPDFTSTSMHLTRIRQSRQYGRTPEFHRGCLASLLGQQSLHLIQDKISGPPAIHAFRSKIAFPRCSVGPKTAFVVVLLIVNSFCVWECFRAWILVCLCYRIDVILLCCSVIILGTRFLVSVLWNRRSFALLSVVIDLVMKGFFSLADLEKVKLVAFNVSNSSQSEGCFCLTWFQ